MKNFILLVALFLVAPFAQGSSPQHLLVGGSGWNKIAIILSLIHISEPTRP